MRPPSYYTSIAQSNDRSRSSYFGDPSRTTNQQLRSSFSSTSSSSYVNRSHLPYVPHSTLVAHCFTGVGSSTRPYGSGSSSTSASGSSSAYLSSLASSAQSSSYLSRARPNSSKRPLNSYTSSVTSGSSGSSYLPPRPAYLSSSSAASSTARYRPTASALSSHYKPIRLRERPLLAKLAPDSRVSTAAATTTAHDTQPKTKRPVEHSERATDLPKVHVDKEDEDWSHDLARNISRNKYLIKFREFDKSPTRSGLDLSDEQSDHTIKVSRETEFESKQTTSLSETDDDMKLRQQQTNDDGVKVQHSANVKLSSDHASVNELQLQDHKQQESQKNDNGNCDNSSTNRRVKKIKKKISDVKLAIDTTRSETAEPDVVNQQEAQTTSELKSSVTTPSDRAEVKKERRNVKPKLRPIVAKKQQTDAVKQQEDAQSKEKEQKTPTRVKKLVKKSSETRESRHGETDKEKNVVTDTKSTVDDVKENIDPTINVTKRKASDSKLKVDTSLASLSKGNHQQVSSKSTPESGTKSARLRFRDYNYEDFNFLTVLGHGGWGFVILAELKDYDACFAVKCIKKITIVEDDDYDSIMIERKVLALGNINPFICKLFCTFETDGYLFFVMEYCAGGDLMFHVQREGKFTESRSRFYATEIICAIKFLHNRHIIYRDLKLDNILLDSRGHIRLVDFGMCQCRTYREEMLPSNFCGTPEYISPEIIKGVPYNHSVDWWSFGVLLYEMAVGKMPFRGSDENELLWNVCYEQIHYPMFLSKELTELLKLLLEREPTKRMGMSTCKAGDIYDQPFFRGVDWKAVEELRVEPPFVPEVTSNRDVQNFDSDFTESACELSPVDDDTLAKIDQNLFMKFPYTNPNIFMFEQHR